MCLGVPGKIIAIDGDSATVDYQVEKRQGKILEGDFKVGEYVLLQGGFVVDRVSEREAKEALATYVKAVNSES